MFASSLSSRRQASSMVSPRWTLPPNPFQKLTPNPRFLKPKRILFSTITRHNVSNKIKLPFYHCHFTLSDLSLRFYASDVTIPTVLAVTGIDPAVPNIRMLQDEASAVRLRQDPEYFITSQGAYIYYSRAIPGTATTGPIHDGYYRVNTGLGVPKP